MGFNKAARNLVKSKPVEKIVSCKYSKADSCSNG